jgi:DNA-binding SARP family transcriptional activator
MSQLSLSCFGSFCAEVGENPVRFSTRSARALLIYLAMHAGRAFERDHLAALLWPEASSEQAHTSLRQTLYRLRQSLNQAGAAE